MGCDVHGSGFDVPLLETRFILGRRRWPATLLHMDLMHPARRVWAARFVDCRLGTLEREVLGHQREDDVPGSLIPSLYFDFLRRRHAGPLARVFTHNCDDVLSLVALLGWLGHALAHGEHGVDDGLDVAGVGRLWERLDPDRAAACYRSALAIGLPAPAAHTVRLRLASWEKRQSRWDAARVLWEAATSAKSFDPRPWEELAKYHEHRARDIATAHAVVAHALGLARAAGSESHILNAFSHRLTRLDRRAAAHAIRHEVPTPRAQINRDRARAPPAQSCFRGEAGRSEPQASDDRRKGGGAPLRGYTGVIAGFPSSTARQFFTARVDMARRVSNEALAM